MTKKQKKLNDQRISRIYGQRCSGVQINIMDIGKVFKVGEQAIADGASDEVLGDRMVEFVDLIRKNPKEDTARFHEFAANVRKSVEG